MSIAACPADCDKVACGNGKCELGDNPDNCKQDCNALCGNCVCATGEDDYGCPVDCGFCVDTVCSQCVGENTQTCKADCGSGRRRFGHVHLAAVVNRYWS